MLAHFRAALSFLSILPVGSGPLAAQFGPSLAYFPLVGFFIGLALSGLGAILPLGLGADGRAFALLLTWVLLTGGLHLDGWADSCDGLLATTSPQRRLEIMRDPRNGTWATSGLILLLLGKFLALRALHEDTPLLILAPLWGRLAMIYAVYAYPYARPEGLGGSFRQGFERSHLGLGLGFTLMTSLFIALMWGPAGPLGALALVLMLGGGLFLAWAAGRLGGGLTGDVYGAVCEGLELVCLWGVVLIL
jgi:adenosylcobinamide-GDP ribazoletransferase